MPSTHVSLSYHIIFSTKNRRPVLGPDLRPRVHEMLGGCVRTAGGITVEIGGAADHVHLLAGLRATHCVADFIRDIKHATSSWMHDSVGLRDFAWQEGYGAFTVSAHDCDGLISYIRGQEEHHRRRTFREEYREMLVDLGVAFDERYLW